MNRFIFAVLLQTHAIVSIWPLESSNELCGIEYKCKCSKEEKLIDCSNLMITELTAELRFSSTEKVYFQNNQIKILRRNFGEGESVKELDLSHNSIDFVASSAFSMFPNLIRLDISHNRIWTLSLDMLSGLNQLQELDLSYNGIQSFFDSVFAPTPKLRKLYLRFNPLVVLDINKFQYLTQLENLDLQYTGLVSLGDDLFVHNSRLKYLSLASNGLEKVPSGAIGSSRRLLTLELSDNPIPVIEAGAFKGLSNLTTLYLNRMKDLTIIKDYAFQGLINLRTLHCSYNKKLTEIGPLAFASNNTLPLKNIELVYFRDNGLTVLSKKLLNWDSLYHLDLNRNPWNCDCNIGWLNEMHWKHEIQYDVRCDSPSKFSGKLIGALKREDFKCYHHMSAQLIVTLTLITTVAFTAVLATIGVIMNRKKRWCISYKSKVQAKYQQVSRVKDEEDVVYEPKE